MEALMVAEKHEAAERSRLDWIGLDWQCDIVYVGEKWTRVKGEQSQTQKEKKYQSSFAWKHSRISVCFLSKSII